MNLFKVRVDMVNKMDVDLMMNADDTTYDAWLDILGDYYDTVLTKTAFIKNALLADKDLWNKLNNFYNLHMN